MAYYQSAPFSLEQFERWLDTFLNFEKLPHKNMFWLDTMQLLCNRLAHPENAAPCFHVAGSKGKGSVATMIACILEAAGFSAGLYTSPHIADFRERVSTPHGFFDNSVYGYAARELMACISSTSAESLTRPITWFELVTLYAFLCFRRAAVDYSVYEVGMGGRLDATNVVTPRAGCITAIEREHTEYLGDTLEKIAAEKAGIIKAGIPVIVAAQKSAAVRNVFEKKAEECGSMCIFVDDFTTFLEYSYMHMHSKTSLSPDFPLPAMRLSFESPLFSRRITATMRLLGNAQARNAVQAALAVKTALPDIAEEAIERGLAHATLPARFEIVPPGKLQPPIIYDGAHTVQSIAETIATLKAVFPTAACHALFACGADKRVDDIAPLFCGAFEKITVTTPGTARQSDLAHAERAFRNTHVPCECISDFEAAVRTAFSRAQSSNAVLLVVGSFYLVADVKKLWSSHARS